jgi:hypothetical protein
MQETTRHFVGIGGWEHDILNSCFYPGSVTTSSQKLAYYARWFNTVEVRSTFWDDTLNADDAREWVNAVQERKEFFFNVKLHSTLTHRHSLGTLALCNMDASVLFWLNFRIASRTRVPIGSIWRGWPYGSPRSRCTLNSVMHRGIIRGFMHCCAI